MSKKTSSKKLWITIGSIFIGLLILGGVGRAAGWFNSEPQGISVETNTAKLKTITQLVSATGKIQPEVEVIISPDVSGEIIELVVKEGDVVNRGDLLLRIRPDIIQAQIDQLNASLLSQKARLEQTRAGLLRAKLTYENQKKLFQKQLISEIDYITAKTNFEAEEANLKASEYLVLNAEAQLKQKREELEQTIIRAPIDGTISKLNVERGERVVGSIQMAGTELLRIARMEQMEVRVKVNENDIVNVAVGDTSIISVDAYPGRSIQGIITEIANSANVTGAGTTEQVTDYDVKIRIITPHNRGDVTRGSLVRLASDEQTMRDFAPNLKPGMSASVDIRTETVYDVIAVPIQAVTIRDFSARSKSKAGKAAETKKEELAADSTKTQEKEDIRIAKEDLRRVVFVVVDGIAQRREVQTGISDDSHIQILSGLDVAEEIVVGSYRVLSQQLQDQDKVKTNKSVASRK